MRASYAQALGITGSQAVGWDTYIANMRQLLPEPTGEIDPIGLLITDLREPKLDRPWVMANMVTAVDGAIALSGRSGELSGEADRRLFHALRSLADVVLVGAGTARAERYHRPRLGDAARERRLAAGDSAAPRLAVVSNSGQIPEDQPFLDGPGQDPLILVPDGVNASTSGVEYRFCGEQGVRLHTALQSIHDDGARLVLCEGGPRLLGDLAQLGLLDELFVTLSPKLGGGSQVGLLGPVEELGLDLTLRRLFYDRDFLMLDYVVDANAVSDSNAVSEPNAQSA